MSLKFKFITLLSYFKANKLLHSPDSIPHPREIGIETINCCNARCSFCPLFHGEEQLDRKIRPVTTMSSELFRKICDQIASWPEKPGCIYLNMDGEPLMDPLLHERLSVLKETGLAQRVFLQTNGQLMNEENARAIINAEIGRIFYALDGATKEMYESMRVKCDFEKVLHNLRCLVRIRDEQRASTGISLKFVRTKKNEHEVEDCYTMVGEFLNPELDNFHDTISHDWAVESLASNEMIYNIKSKNRRTTGCQNLNTLLVIYADGRVPACCLDYNLSIRNGKDFGNANEFSLLDIWNGNALNELRAEIVQGQVAKKCAECLLRFELVTEKMPAAQISRPDMISLSPGYGYIYSFKA